MYYGGGGLAAWQGVAGWLFGGIGGQGGVHERGFKGVLPILLVVSILHPQDAIVRINQATISRH